MELSIGGRLKHAWDVFKGQDQYQTAMYDYGPSYSRRPDRPYRSITNEKSIVTSIYTTISVDVAAVDLRHVRVDENQQYLEEIPSGLNNCLTVEANIDQASQHFVRDIVSGMFTNGTVAVVPVDTTLNPEVSGGYDIKTMRVGRIVQWYPQHVRVEIYNDKTGMKQEITIKKRVCAIIENPFYDVMNEPNGTLQRLLRKLNLLDVVDEKSSAGKLDIIMQLPYVVKSEARKQQAEERRKAVEVQLQGSEYGIAYVDATEKITQLNRPAESSLLSQIQYLTELLFSQLGLTQEIMNGSADEQTMLNYYNRTVEPILSAISQAMKRTFLTQTARTQGQSIEFYRDPFKMTPVKDLAEIADKFTRNAILSSNEVRGIIGFKPSKDPKADTLSNKNIPEPDSSAQSTGGAQAGGADSVLADLETQIDSLLANPGGATVDASAG